MKLNGAENSMGIGQFISLSVCVRVVGVWWNHIAIKIGRFNLVRWLIWFVNACNSNEFDWKLVTVTMYIVQWTPFTFERAMDLWIDDLPIRLDCIVCVCARVCVLECGGKLIKCQACFFRNSSHLNPWQTKSERKKVTTELSDEPFYEF